MSLTCAKSFENVVFHFLFKQKISLPKVKGTLVNFFYK